MPENLVPKQHVAQQEATQIHVNHRGNETYHRRTDKNNIEGNDNKERKIDDNARKHRTNKQLASTHHFSSLFQDLLQL
jgi:hypothetical protein